MAGQTVKIGDIAKVISGHAFKSSEFKKGGPIPVIKIKNIRIGCTDLNEAGYVSDSFLKIDNKFHVTAGDILISLTGSHMTQPNSVVGRVAIYQDSLPTALLNQRAGKIIPKNDEVNKKFLFYVLMSEHTRKEIAQMAHGAASQANVSPSQVESVEIFLPENAQQEIIANILAAYDNLIENNSRRIAILEEMAQSLYREWFVKFRLPDHENTKFVDSPLGKIPEGWQVVALEDICERITDGAHKSPKSVDDGVPMASVKDMHDFGLNLSTCRQISEEDYLELKRQDSIVRGNDVLIAKDGSYLKHTFVVEKDEKIALLSSIAMLRPNERVKSHWLAYCLRSENVKERMKQCVSGVAVPRIILKDFRQFKIVLPPQEVQNEWDLIVEKNVKLCWKLIRKNANLQKQRDLLLPRLISGNIQIG